MSESSFLLVGSTATTERAPILQSALAGLGEVQVVPQNEAEEAIARSGYLAVIIDAGGVEEIAELTSRLLAKRPGTRVIIATASPTWTRARQAFKAGAADYIRWTQDEGALRAAISEVLQLPPPALVP